MYSYFKFFLSSPNKNFRIGRQKITIAGIYAHNVQTGFLSQVSGKTLPDRHPEIDIRFKFGKRVQIFDNLPV